MIQSKKYRDERSLAGVANTPVTRQIDNVNNNNNSSNALAVSWNLVYCSSISPSRQPNS